MLMCGSDRAWVRTPNRPNGCGISRIATLASISRLWSNHRQLGSQISMFHVDCEIGMPVRIGYIQAKLVIISAM